MDVACANKTLLTNTGSGLNQAHGTAVCTADLDDRNTNFKLSAFRNLESDEENIQCISLF